MQLLLFCPEALRNKCILYSSSNKTSVCVYLMPWHFIFKGTVRQYTNWNPVALTPNPASYWFIQGGMRQAAKLTGVIVSCSHCAWWDWKCCSLLTEATPSSLPLWKTVQPHCKLHPRLWPGKHFSWKKWEKNKRSWDAFPFFQPMNYKLHTDHNTFTTLKEAISFNRYQ